MKYYLYRIKFRPDPERPEISYRTDQYDPWGVSGSFSSEEEMNTLYTKAGFRSIQLFDINDFETQVQISLGVIPQWILDEIRSHDPEHNKFYIAII